MRTLVLACVIAVAALGCGSNTPSNDLASPEPRSVAPVSIVPGSGAPPGDATPIPGAPAGPTDEEIAQAMRERADFGLRADEAWVRQVAANPRSRTGLVGFPLLPEEEVEFQARQEKLLRVARVVQGYTDEHPEQVAGLFIDQEHRLVVVLVTADVETHRAAIDALLPEGGPVDVRLARYTRAELEALMERIVNDSAWFKAIGAAFVEASLNEMQNRVDLEISSANGAAPGLIAAHFGVGPDALRITSDGTGIILQPRGTVRGRVVRADGSPPGENDYSLALAPDVAGTGDCGSSEMPSTVGPDGGFELPCSAGGWTITVQEPAATGLRDVGTGHVVVPPGQAVDVVIKLEP